MITLEKLPTEIILLIFHQLHAKEQRNLGILSRRLYQISAHPSLWQKLELEFISSILDEDMLMTLCNTKFGAFVPEISRILSLSLSSCLKISDRGFQLLYPIISGILQLDLSHCTQLTGDTIEGIVKRATKIMSFNISYTLLGDGAVAHVLDYCHCLCDLKLMGCINITLENIKLKIDKLDIRGANVGTGTLKRLKNDIRYLEY